MILVYLQGSLRTTCWSCSPLLEADGNLENLYRTRRKKILKRIKESLNCGGAAGGQYQA